MDTRNYFRTVAIIILLMTYLPLWAYSVTGRIKSGKGVINGIEVRIFDKDGNEVGSAVPDNKGYFKINIINQDNLIVEVSGEGYNPMRLEVMTGDNDTDLGILNIEKTTDLQEVTVTAKSRVTTPDKTIVYVTQTERERAASPFNMLTILAYKVPEMNVRESEGTLSIDGETPEILVNGIRRSMAYISAINSDAIERIEFSPVPDIRYGKRYLNIIVRRPPEGGWLMADVKGALTTPRNFLKGVIQYSRGKNDFMFYYDDGFRHGRREYDNQEEHYNGGGKDITLEAEGMPSSTLDRYHNFNLYFTRVPSEKSMFSATGSVYFHDNSRKFHNHVTELTHSYDRTNRRGYDDITANLSLYYYLKASNTAVIEIEGAGSYTHSDTYRDLSYSTGYQSLLSTTGNTRYLSTQVVWIQTLPFARLRTGLNFSYSDASTKYLIDGVKSRQPISTIRGNAFTSMGGSLFTVGYNLSLGVNFLKVKLKQSMAAPNLSLSLQRNLGNNFNISYSLSCNAGMPGIVSYNEVATPVNDLMYHIGVKKLKTQGNISNRIQLGFSKNKLYTSLSGSLSHSSNPIMTEYRYQDNPQESLYGYFLELSGNGKYFRQYNIDFNIGLSNLWNFLSFSANTGWQHSSLRASENFDMSSWKLGLNLGLYWKGWQLNMSAQDLVPTWYISGASEKYRYSSYTQLALYKKFGNFNLSASWSYPFRNTGMVFRTESLTSVVQRASEFRMKDQGNLFEIGIRYQFVTGKLLNKKQRSLQMPGSGENGVRWDY